MQLLQQSITPSAEELLLQYVINVPAVKAAHQSLLFMLEARYSPQPGSFTQTRFLCNVWGKNIWLLEVRVMIYLDRNSWGVKYHMDNCWWPNCSGSFLNVSLLSEMSGYLSEVKCKGKGKKKKESVIHKEFVLIWHLSAWTFFFLLFGTICENKKLNS